jgi:hypothetical protein
MTHSDDWDQWYFVFAATTPPPPNLQALIDKYPSLKYTELALWKNSRWDIPVPQRAVDLFCQPAQDDTTWLVAALQDERRRWFVARLADLAGSVPESLFEPMLISAAEAADPSLNKFFIRPCIQSFGAERVKAYLVALAESADPRRVVGAIHAMYWTDQAAEAHDVLERRKVFLLEACFSTTSTYVRNEIVGTLGSMDPSLFPATHRELVTRAQVLYEELSRPLNRQSS